MENKKKVKNPNLTSETFRLNKEVTVDAEIIEFLERSNNKTGLIKDAIMMYKALVDSGAYNSPFLSDTKTDWSAIFSKLDPAMMLGATPSAVKNGIKEELRSYQEPVHQTREELSTDTEYNYNYDDDGDDDNDLDY